jgi:uncharacterized membrane protein HdeD (DUF308 family)
MSNTKKASVTKVDRNWLWLLVLGVIFVFLGFIGLGMTVSLTIVSMLFFGFLLIIAGVSQIFDTFKCKGWKAAVSHAAIAFLYLIGGGLVIYDPLLASTLITALLASVLIIIGLTRFIMAAQLKNSHGWGWLILAGLTALILGILILVQWPISGLWVIGLFIAIELMVDGWTYIFLAFAMK